LTFCVIGWSPQAARAQGLDDPEMRALEPAMVLRALSFDDAGTFVGPASRDFWERVFDDERIPDNPERELRGLDAVPLIDAAYVLAATCNGPPPTGRARLRALAFVQRVFRDHDRGELPAVLVAARAAIRYPMLMLSVERMGISDARVYSSLARAASRLERIRQPLQLRNALSQFQGAAALVERARLAGAMTPDVAGDALLALAELPLTRNGQFNGAVGGWLVDHLLPGLGVRVAPAFDSDVMDQQLLAALAGPADADPPVVEWEGLAYRFDRRAAQFERFIQARDRFGGNHLDAVIALSATAAALASGAVADPAPLVEQLERSLSGIGTPDVGIHVPNTRSVSYEDTVRPVVEDLQEIARRGRLRRLPDAARRLLPVVDVLLADLLRTLPYVVHVSNSYGVRLMGDDIAARHEFGIRIGDAAERARAPWSMPRGGSAPPVPFHRLGQFWIAPEGDDRFTGVWHVYGALMSLDLALARFHLPRLAGVIPSETPAILSTEENYFAHGATLFNPAVVTGSQVSEIAAAIRKGRGRLEQLRDDPSLLPDVAREAGLGALRRNELAWTLRHRPDTVDRFLSRNELFWLGLRDGGDSQVRPPAGWGAPAVWVDGCLCVRIPQPDALDLSIVSAERLASGFADLQLALAEAVDDLALPAPIVGDLLPLAMRELLDGVGATRRGRLDALVGYVHNLPRERIEDYVASLVGPGRPLRPI
jgi:hypothetical protein